ncbi:hypothetical protein ACSFC1_07840 [Pseudothermotoga sp. U03pept]|uniref:hypothetical protein n=1 Tax=Pseudothermotoga sp. U03pept TaxID=3447012 RepID=UPI003F0FA9DE
MKGKNLIMIWAIVLAGLLLSSCAFNLFADLELQNLLNSEKTDQKLVAASGALSSKDYDKAIALAGSVLNELLGLDLSNEQLMNLLDSTSTLYDFAEALYEKKDELNDQAIEAVKIILEAAAAESEKSIADVISDLEDIAQELGLDISEFLPKSKNNEQEDFWQIIETNAGTIVSTISKFFDDAQLLKFLTSGYYALATATQTADSSPMYAAFCAWYDLGYMLNLIFDTDNDGKITDEQLIKSTITNPASFVELTSNATSGLYHDETACNEFVWAYEIMNEVIGIIGADLTLPDLPATTDLYGTEKLSDLFNILAGGEE